MQKKLEMAMHWTADLFFQMDFTQFVTSQAIERAHHHLQAAREESQRHEGHDTSEASRGEINAAKN